YTWTGDPNSSTSSAMMSSVLYTTAGLALRDRFLVGASLVAHQPKAKPAQQAEKSQSDHQPDRLHGQSPQDSVVERDEFSTHRKNDRNLKNGCDNACHDPSRNPIGWPPPGNPARN